MDYIQNPETYLSRMSKPLQEKLKVAKYITNSCKSVLDVGCADGTVTMALADLYPNTNFVGIDLDEDFIKIANERVGKRTNVKFECVYLRDTLAMEERFDVVLFCSVLHEFFSYGEGISSVVKALSDARELLNPSGEIVIRDMLLYEYAAKSQLWLSEMVKKIRSKEEMIPLLDDFEKYFGKIVSIKQVNHFLLKYMYTDNWPREVKENYTPVCFEQYDKILEMLDMEVSFQRSSTIPFLKDKWRADFGFSEDELESFRSTGFIVARKK
jgi:SAM-dependent methyltransferase